MFADTAAIWLFVSVGELAHGGRLSGDEFVRNGVPILVGWAFVGGLVDLSRRPTPRRYVATWLGGVTLGVVIRAAVLGRLTQPREVAFLATSLVFVLAFDVATRAVVRIVPRRRTAR